MTIEVGQLYRDNTNPPWNDLMKVHNVTPGGVSLTAGIGAMYKAPVHKTLAEAQALVDNGSWTLDIDYQGPGR